MPGFQVPASNMWDWGKNGYLNTPAPPRARWPQDCSPIVGGDPRNNQSPEGWLADYFLGNLELRKTSYSYTHNSLRNACIHSFTLKHSMKHPLTEKNVFSLPSGSHEEGFGHNTFLDSFWSFTYSIPGKWSDLSD